MRSILKLRWVIRREVRRHLHHDDDDDDGYGNEKDGYSIWLWEGVGDLLNIEKVLLAAVPCYHYCIIDNVYAIRLDYA